jgi:type IV secretory pathway VirB2 component (pilin)
MTLLQNLFHKVGAKARVLKADIHSAQVWLGAAVMAAAPNAMSANVIPWEKPVCMIAKSMEGVIAPAVCIIAIVLAGCIFALGEASGIFKTLGGVIGGSSFALLATNWLGFLNGNASYCASTIF